MPECETSQANGNKGVVFSFSPTKIYHLDSTVNGVKGLLFGGYISSCYTSQEIHLGPHGTRQAAESDVFNGEVNWSGWLSTDGPW